MRISFLVETSELSASERAYRQLRRRIVSLELTPNQPIAETQLADLFGMSRTPIREALTRLASEGLVDFRSRAGTTVAPIRLDAVKSAHYVREKLELAVVRDAVCNNSPKAIFNIKQCIEKQGFAISQADYAMFFASDEEMHQRYCEMIGMASVWSVIADAKKHMDRVRMLSLQTTEPTDLGGLLDDHTRIIDAVIEGDEQAAVNFMKIHLKRVILDLNTLVERNQEYFDLEPVENGDQSKSVFRGRI
jgi:DNA-binding GntR family transcriptional regulator